MAKDLIVII